VKELRWNAAGCVLAGYTFSQGNGSISATSEKVTTSGEKPIRENDNGTCSGSHASQAGTQACACLMMISKAGQLKAEAV